jgi:formate transporter
MAPSDPVVSFKTPKLTVIAASNIALTKALHRLDEEFLLSILAGFYIGFGGFYSLAVAGAVPGFTELHIKGIQRLCLGALFPIALMLIVMTGAELWTGNTFIMTVGLLTKKVTGRQVLRNWCVQGRWGSGGGGDGL